MTPLFYTHKEGCMWEPWPYGSIPRKDLMEWRGLGKFIECLHYRQIKFQALMFSNGLIWDLTVGFDWEYWRRHPDRLSVLQRGINVYKELQQ